MNKRTEKSDSATEGEFSEKTVRDVYRFLAHEKYTEIRLIDPNGRKKPKRFFVESEDEFVGICRRYDGEYNIYTGINDRVRRGGRKQDVHAVRAVIIDIDAKKPKKQPASDEELRRAEEVADRIISDFTALGFKKPVKCMSGNGYHLWFAIPPIILSSSNRRDVERRIQAFNRWIADRYGNEHVSIDNIGDLPRIIKVIGTKSIKGIPSEHRPHRYSYCCGDFKRREDPKLLEFIMNLQIQQEQKKQNSAGKRIRKFEELLERDEKLRRLYSGDWSGYVSRSEAEQALVCKLVYYGFSESEIREIMSSSAIGKWNEAGESYREVTLRKGFEFVRGEGG